MKLIKFDLPIDGTKVRNLEELRDHFTPEILELYRNGLLTKWLASRQISQELSAIKAIEVQEDQALLQRLCEIFDIQADEDFIRAACATATIIPTPAVGQAEPKLRLTLPMDGVQIKTREELRCHFTSEILDHYRSGLLSQWLLSRGLEGDWQAVSALKSRDDHELILALSRIFGVGAEEAPVSLALDLAARSDTPPPAPAPGAMWIEPHTGMRFVWIPPGGAIRGTKDNEFEFFVHGRDSDPRSPSSSSGQLAAGKVGGFWLGQFPVTQAQWRRIMLNNPSRHYGMDRPVENMSFLEVLTFLRLLTIRNNGKSCFRLPSSTEWLYAAQAGVSPAYWLEVTEGSYEENRRKMGKYGWFAVNSGDKTHPVGQLSPNPWGLHDMLGNVSELASKTSMIRDDPQGNRTKNF